MRKKQYDDIRDLIVKIKSNEIIVDSTMITIHDRDNSFIMNLILNQIKIDVIKTKTNFVFPQ